MHYHTLIIRDQRGKRKFPNLTWHLDKDIDFQSFVKMMVFFFFVIL